MISGILPWLLLKSRVPGSDLVSASLKLEDFYLSRLEGSWSAGQLWYHLDQVQARTELYLAVWAWERHVLHIILLKSFC